MNRRRAKLAVGFFNVRFAKVWASRLAAAKETSKLAFQHFTGFSFEWAHAAAKPATITML